MCFQGFRGAAGETFPEGEPNHKFISLPGAVLHSGTQDLELVRLSS